jgi:hypothetical protein
MRNAVRPADTVAMSERSGEPRRCPIEGALGRVEFCPQEQCPFWDGAAGAGTCVFDPVDLAGRAAVARWLHDLRAELELGTVRAEEARHHFYERLNDGRSD